MNLTLKNHLLITAILTQLSALFYNGSNNNLPYFPIEISRTASSNTYSWCILIIGSISSIWHIVYDDVLTYHMKIGLGIAWAGLCGLALFDDLSYLRAHMYSSYIMIIGGLYTIYVSPGTSIKVKVIFIACALLLFISRLVIKTIVIMGIEMEQNLFSIHPWWALATDSGFRNSIKSNIVNIMFNGEIACRHAQYTLTLFKATGVMQWLFFYVLLEGISVIK